MFSQNQSKYAPQENLPKVAEVRYLDADEVEIAVREQMIERMVEAQQRAENEESEELSSQTPATRSFRAKIFIEKNGFFPVYFYTNDWSEGLDIAPEKWFLKMSSKFGKRFVLLTEEECGKWDNGGSVNKDYDCSDYGNKPKPINRRPSYSTEHLVLMSAGPAGLTAAIYAKRALLKILILEKTLVGGKLNKTAEIENYPGFASIQGPELAEKISQQVHHYQIEWHYEEQAVAVVGGGYSALEAALYLSKVASKVYLIHRRDSFRAEKEIVAQMKKNSKIIPVINSVVKEIRGQDKVEKIIIRHLNNGKESELLVRAIFPQIGLSPFSGFAHQLGVCDLQSYIKIKEDCSTEIVGLFAAGDVARSHQEKIKQIVTAVAEGAIAAQAVIKYLEKWPLS
ncbi:29341_t:CDS:2 [Gigaspora margarita]|uniref:29341_t:CDS:1 n=1 Tax=Gigaspora margarita TaxID=4874 RepID=A0ABN7UJ84_GIGMA|nr:29341_t:CDS:2 [Gigaspora margarita]